MNGQSDCECIYHRYHVMHLCECGKILSHSQGDWNDHRMHKMINVDPEWYKHGDTFSELFDRLHIMGLLPYFSDNFPAVYEKAADLQ